MSRTLAIGDIHGGLKALEQVFERAAVNATDRLIFVGDYVDGWSQSAPVIDFLLNLKQECIFIKGNHDLWCEQWLYSGYADKTWLAHGGKEAVESYRHITASQKEKHLHFFATLELYHVDPQNRLFIHGGFTAGDGPENEPDALAFTIDRTLWKNALACQCEFTNGKLPAPYNLFQEIFIGHTPTLYFDQASPMHALNVWNLDTGAAFTGKLSMMDIDTKSFWQSDPLPQLYPGEKGRNK